ncbi:MAG: FtsH protease activity modulator HflK, partial [Micavibrio sp.]
MAWDEDGGNKDKNPWGSGRTAGGGNKGPRNPWGSGQGGGSGGGNHGGGGRGPGGPGGPDFDDFLNRMQGGMKTIFPGNLGGGGRYIFLGAAALAALWLASGFYIVNPGEHAVVKRFGAWNRTVALEGLKYHLPAPIESAAKFKVNEIRTMNIGFIGPAGRGGPGAGIRDVPEESLMLTSDFNIVDLDFVVQWNISSAEDFLFNIQNPENTLRKVAQSAIREVVGQTRMFPVITTERGAVAEKSKAIMQNILNEYGAGINITQVLLNSAEVHPDVQSAFQDVQSAKQDAEDVQNRAQAYREDIIPKARGAATKVRQEAEAYREAVIARATGDADRFNSVLAAYQSGQDVTKERMYIETMESILAN